MIFYMFLFVKTIIQVALIEKLKKIIFHQKLQLASIHQNFTKNK